MTRWLQAARGASVARTEPTQPTEPARRLCGGGGDATERGVSSVSSVLSEGGRGTPGGLAPLDPLDPEGLPFTACRACGGGDWWKPAAQPFEGPGWACAACTPPPAEMWRHACAVPVGGMA